MANVSSSNGLEKRPKLRFPGFDEPWGATAFGDLVHEFSDRTKEEDEDTLLSAAIEGMFLNTELFGHQRGTSNKGYKKIKYGTMVLSTQNLHLGNANVNLRFEHGMVSPAYKTYDIIGCSVDLIAQWIKSEAAKHFFYNATTVGASVCRRNVEWDTLYEQPLYLPSLDEQEKVASFLALLSDRINKQHLIVSALKKYKRGLLHYYFSDENTQHWTPHTISQIGKVVTGSTPPTSDRSNYDGDLLFCSPGDVGNKKYISSTEKRVSIRGFSLGRPIPPNSVIVTCIGLIGKLGIAASAMITNQQINALVVSQNFDHEFIYYALENFFPEYRSKVAMQTLPILSKSEFEKLMIKAPTIDVQHRISAHLSIMDRRIEQTQQELNLLCERRKGVMQQLFI